MAARRRTLPPPAAASRTPRDERLLDLVTLLLGAHAPITLFDLRQNFPGDYAFRDKGERAAAERKWERDKAELLALGVPIRWLQGDEDRPDGYVLDREAFFLPELGLDLDESAAIVLAATAALAQPAFPLRRDLAHALGKLRFSAAAAVSPEEAGLFVQLPPLADDGAPGVLDALGRALEQRREVELTYERWDGTSTVRRVAPYGLAFQRGAWRLVGHCRLRDGLRTFHVERIRGLREPPGPGAPLDVPQDFTLADRLPGEAWELPLGPAHQVRLRIDPPATSAARARFGAAVTTADDGGAFVQLCVTNVPALVRELLALAPHAELLEPAALRGEISRVARAIAADHGDHADHGEAP